MPTPVYTFNTIGDLRTFYEDSIIQDSPDPTETYALFSQAKNLIESLYKPKILESLDQSQTANVGDTYLSMKTLPADCRTVTSLNLTRSGSILTLPYYPVPFRNRDRYQRVPRRFYVDAKNKQFALTGTVNTSSTINLFYQVRTDDIINDQSIIVWPNEFWVLVAYWAAAIRQGNFDADAITFRMSTEQRAVYEEVINAFIAWDHDIKLQDMGNRGGFADEVNDGDFGVDIGLM